MFEAQQAAIEVAGGRTVLTAKLVDLTAELGEFVFESRYTLRQENQVFDALLFIAVLSPSLDTFAKDFPLWEQR